jgi:cyclophilin family peptidyl-prolyl cis-trans isomerase
MTMLKIVLLCLSLLLPAIASAEAATPANPRVVIKTSEGDITVQLYADKSPVTVANFLTYVDSGFYKDTIFHRVIPEFMIQGGGFGPDMKEKETRAAIVNESNNSLHNVRGTIAMARTNDPDSATAQFFINQRSNLRLDSTAGRPGYAVFGEVIQGMDIVDFIATAPTGQVGGMGDVPKKAIVIKEIVRQQP